MGTILQKLEKVLLTKEAIRNAIIAKGQALPESEPFSVYPEKIAAIQSGIDTSDATATAGDILSGKTAYVKGGKVTGSIASKGAADLTASGAEIVVPAGYYPSQVSKSVATATHPKPTLSRSGGTITATHVQSAGYTPGGTTEETLSISTQAGKTVTPTTYQQTAVTSGRLTTGAVYVAGDSNLVASNIKAGVSIFGVAGSHNGQTIRKQLIDSVPITKLNDNQLRIDFSSLQNTPTEILLASLIFKNVIRYGVDNPVAPAVFSSTRQFHSSALGDHFGLFYNYTSFISSLIIIDVQQNGKIFTLTMNGANITQCGTDATDCLVIYV